MNNPFDLSKKFPGYFSPWVFRLTIILLVVLALFAWSETGFRTKNYVYAYCPVDAIGGRCASPCVNDTPLSFCDNYIVAGQSIGERPPELMEEFDIICLLVFLVAFIINHLLYLWRTDTLWK